MVQYAHALIGREMCLHECLNVWNQDDHTSTNFKMFLSWKLDKFTLFTHSLVGWNLENLYKHAVPIYFCFP